MRLSLDIILKLPEEEWGDGAPLRGYSPTERKRRGGLKYWSNGVLEYWNIGMMGS